MKRIVITLLLFHFAEISFGQIEVIPVLIGKSENRVVQYMDSLNSLKNNPYAKIQRSTTSFGDLKLSSSFAISDQSFYKCLEVVCVFQRIKGTEICIQQLIMGYTENASSNLNYVKDNFTRVGDKWETNFYDVKDYKIIAEYKSVDGEDNMVGGSKGTYSLFYYLAKADK